LFDGRFRASVDKGVKPFGTALNRTGLSPDHLTALGLFMAVPAAIAIGTGRLFLGLVLLAASAVPDLLDGALAKASGTSSKRGAFFDSVADRVTDALILGGLGWYLQTQRHGHAALLPFAILAASSLISTSISTTRPPQKDFSSRTIEYRNEEAGRFSSRSAVSIASCSDFPSNRMGTPALRVTRAPAAVFWVRAPAPRRSPFY